MTRKLVFILFLLAGHALAETAAFDPATNVLTVPSVQIDSQLYSTTQVALPTDGKWSVVGIGTAAATPTTDTAVFDLNTQVLTVPSLRVGPRLYSTTQVALPADGQWAAVSIGAERAATTSNTLSQGACWDIPPGTTCSQYDSAQKCTSYTTTQGTKTPLVVSPTTIAANTHEPLTLAIGGGTPPYNVTSSRNAVASVGSVEQSNNPCQASANISTLVAGEAIITVTDSAGKQVSATLTVSDIQVPPFAVSPTTVTTRMGEPITLNIVGGKPPYRVSSSREFVAYPDSGTYNSTTPSGYAPQAEAMVRTRNSGVATITVSDANGNQKTVAVTVSDLQFGVSPTAATARSGEPIKITIAGGRPPYLLSTSNSFIAYPDSGIYETAMTWVEATIRTRSPGATIITINDADGHQTAVAITVTR